MVAGADGAADGGGGAEDGEDAEDGSMFALHGVNMSVAAGELVCVVGRVGSGKTSLVGLAKAQKGLRGSVPYPTKTSGSDEIIHPVPQPLPSAAYADACSCVPCMPGQEACFCRQSLHAGAGRVSVKHAHARRRCPRCWAT